MYNNNNYYPYGGNYNSPYGASATNSPYSTSTLQQPMNMMNAQKQEVVRVNGRNGAEAYQLQPNSSILLLDETAPIIWLKITDGAGYPTITPYDIVPHQEETPVSQTDISLLENRISKLEEYINGQSNIATSRPSKQSVSTNTNTAVNNNRKGK